jgi:hypothetical protein
VSSILVFSAKHAALRRKRKTGCFGIRILCPSGAICLPADCCFSDEVRFVLDQHAELDFNSASSLKQQSAGRHIAPLGHNILIPKQPVFLFLLNAARHDIAEKLLNWR